MEIKIMISSLKVKFTLPCVSGLVSVGFIDEDSCRKTLDWLQIIFSLWGMLLVILSINDNKT